MRKCGNFRKRGSVNTGIPKFKKLKQEDIKELWTGSEPLIATCIANSLTNETPPFVPPTVEDVVKKTVEVKSKRSHP